VAPPQTYVFESGRTFSQKCTFSAVPQSPQQWYNAAYIKHCAYCIQAKWSCLSSIVLIAYKRNGAAYQALCLLRTSEMELLFNCQTIYCKESLATPPSLVLLTDDRSCMYTWNLTCGQPQRCIWSLSLRSLASYDVALALSRNNLLHTLLPLLLLLLRLLLLISVFIKIANLPW